MWCPNSPAVTWTHILLIVLHRASHKGNDSHLVILALPVLQGQLQKEEGVLESATGIPQLFPITLFLTASIYCEPTITLAPDLTPSPSLPFYLCLSVDKEEGLILHSRAFPFKILTDHPTISFPLLSLHHLSSLVLLLTPSVWGEMSKDGGRIPEQGGTTRGTQQDLHGPRGCQCRR